MATKKNPKCLSTLDYWFVPTLLENGVSECKIITAPSSDHLAVKMNINISNVKKGNGVWKFNNSLLKDDNYISALNNKIDQSCAEFKNTLDKRMLWDFIKNQIRCITMTYCKNKNKKGNINNLEKRLDKSRAELAKNNTNENHEKFLKDKLNLEVAWQNVTNGAKVRSKEKWIQEGEKKHKILFELGKKKCGTQNNN
jgi:hypothetical protein